jgi:nucleoside-diphosphate-sugar epimerase
MKIFIAGATGAMGMPLARALVAENHEVVGLARSSEKGKVLEEAGARVAVADVLNAGALEQALRSAEPDWVVDLLTAIPKSGPTRVSHMKPTNELRVKGTANLLRAAIAAGAKRIVGESMIFVYGFGDHGDAKKTEDDAFQTREAKAWLQEIVDAIRSLEDQFLEANKQGLIEAIPLRFGLVYGSDPITERTLHMLKKRLLPTVSGANGICSWIHMSDVVSGTIAALERGRPGEVYNIVDDDPVSLNDFLTYAAKIAGAKSPFSIPLWLLRWLMPYVAVFASTRLRISNQKARRDLQWQPKFPNYRMGLQQVIAEYEKR